ncbi:MAG: type II secretion system protein [bacterium]|nr:type II secretion system protein [bacterium]
MTSRCSNGTRGFTLIEMSIVLMLSGLLMAVAFTTYTTYMKKQRATDSYDKQQIIASTLSDYSSAQHRMPCPADPQLPLTNANAGKELPALFCADLATRADGVCMSFNGSIAPAGRGVCKTSGRDTNDVDTNRDPVLIGAIPFITIKNGLALSEGASFASGDDTTVPLPAYDCVVTDPAGLGWILGVRENRNPGRILQEDFRPGDAIYCDYDGNSALDPGVTLKTVTTKFSDIALKTVLDAYGFQMSYAVTAGKTNANTAQFAGGAIGVVTEAGISVITPPESAHYVLVAHGDNHMGAYNAWGQVPFPCTTANASKDEGNCDLDGTFVQGLRSINTATAATRAEYFDDTVFQSTAETSALWDFVPNSPDIYNVNIGNVGVGTGTNVPLERLDIRGVLKATKTTSDQICDLTGNCFKPDSIAGDSTKVDSLGNPLGTTCDSTYPVAAGKMRVVIAMKEGKVVCSKSPLDPTYTAATEDPTRVVPVLNTACANPGEFIKGFSPAGGILCCNPYLPSTDPSSCLY